MTAFNEFQFSIHDFPTRMLVEGRIDMRFIYGCECSICVPLPQELIAFPARLYSVGFSSSQAGEWMLFYCIVLDHGDPKDYLKSIDIDLFSKGESFVKAMDFLDVAKEVADQTLTSTRTKITVAAPGCLRQALQRKY